MDQPTLATNFDYFAIILELKLKSVMVVDPEHNTPFAN
jgi:hypothetical protein